MTSTRSPCWASATATLTAVVVLPTPPFWLATASTRRVRGRGNRRRAPRGGTDDNTRTAGGWSAGPGSMGANGPVGAHGGVACGAPLASPSTLQGSESGSVSRETNSSGHPRPPVPEVAGGSVPPGPGQPRPLLVRP